MEVPDVLVNLDQRHVYLGIACIILVLIVIFMIYRSYSKKDATPSYSNPVINNSSSRESASAGPSYSRPITRDIYTKPDLPDIPTGRSVGGFSLEFLRGKFKDIIEKDPKRSLGEKACSEAIEHIYGRPFPRVRPFWLINPKTMKQLELDCYNEELGIAVEYNGRQHYDHKAFGQGEFKLALTAERDKLKLDLCDEMGIYVITVPHTVDNRDIHEYILYYLPENYKMRLDNGQTA